MRPELEMSPAVKALVYANLAGYALRLLVGHNLDVLFGLTPQRLLQEYWVWQAVSYLFLHGSAWHLILNLFALWMFGRVVEGQWGSREFVKYYFLCGLGAAALHAAIQPASPFPVIGASGAIYGLLVAFAMIYPDAPVYLWFVLPMKAKHIAILFGLIELVASTGGGTEVSNLAHLGGMITGYVYIRWWWEIRTRTKHFALDLWDSLRGEVSAPRRSKKPRPPHPDDDESAEVDRILDKILMKGVDSLTAEERRTLERRSRNRPQGQGPFHA